MLLDGVELLLDNFIPAHEVIAWPDGGWYPGERMSVLEAVRGFTIDAAYAAFSENDRGSIEVGKLADFTVLDRDIFEIPPGEILRTTVTHTVVGGNIVYLADAEVK